MSPLTSEALSLRQQIQAAFAGAEYPGDDLLVYDTSGYHLECNDVAARFRGKHWKDVTLDMILNHSDAIFFFSPEAYRFYLPAYMIIAALQYDDADRIPDTVVFSLIPPSDSSLIEYHWRRTQGFTPEQRDAIKSFLGFLKKYHGADDTLGDVDKALATL